MKTEFNQIIQGYSWESILLNSQEFVQSPFNPSIFSLEGLADIATFEGTISAIHPMDRDTLDLVAEKLSVATSQYYRQKVSVEITDELIIRVYFSAEVKESFWQNFIQKYKQKRKLKV